MVGDENTITKLISRHYGDDSESVSDILKELGSDADMAKEVSEAAVAEDAAGMADLANEVPIVRFVNLVLFQAVQDRASDIHFEPFEDEFKIRYRVDGALYEMTPPLKHLALPVISRLKVMANLNISSAVCRRTDASVFKWGTGRLIFVCQRCRRSSGVAGVACAGPFGGEPELESLGLPKYVLDYIGEAIQQPNGIFIVTGPTGSAKRRRFTVPAEGECDRCEAADGGRSRRI